MEKALPFEVKSFHSDNGSEFLNWSLHRHLHERGVLFTRSRAYRKNDNAHVEQKNWTHVRQLFGHDRLEHPELVDLMNGIYRHEWRLLQNYFLPKAKLIEKTEARQQVPPPLRETENSPATAAGIAASATQPRLRCGPSMPNSTPSICAKNLKENCACTSMPKVTSIVRQRCPNRTPFPVTFYREAMRECQSDGGLETGLISARNFPHFLAARRTPCVG